MKALKIGLALAVASALAAPAAFAHGGKAHKAYDVCVDAVEDARFNFTGVTFGGVESKHPGPGDRVTAVGRIFPSGSIPLGGLANCDAVPVPSVGSFFVNGTFVAELLSPAKLPQAAADDLAYVDWQFRINGVGAFDTSGPIKRGDVNGTQYPQTITGATVHSNRGMSLKG
ncbi:MAG: hypothetical protein EXR86_16705 [Gammaproteobacteria bacterium]|nr:hypothetical protein [Gammaproteobacteria bacterium]